MWRDLVSQWEQNVNALANQTMASDEFSSSSNQAMTMALKLQQATGSAMATYLATMNLPSRADVTALGERLQAIETYLSRIAASLEATATPDASGRRRRKDRKATKPPRTKQPPSLVEP
jgi:hypothetical protein